MMNFGNSVGARTGKIFELPPLILHPFDNEPRSNLSFDALDCDEAERQRLGARYAELRMLCFLGKDLNRWLGQCVECLAGNPDFAGEGVSESVFITQLLFDPPHTVVKKMHTWGVGNFQILFSRALGLNAVYPFPPAPNAVSAPLLRSFHLYADALFDTRLQANAMVETGLEFAFEIYASGEYSSMLEQAWMGVPED